MRRASEFYLAIATLGLSEIILEILRKWNDFTGSAGDVSGGIKPIDYWFGHTVSQLNQYAQFWVWFIAFAIVMVIAIWLARSPVQRETIAIRDQPQVAATLGVPTLKRRVTMFVLGSGIAAAAGALFVHTKGFANPEDFSITLGLGIFVILIIGGIDSRWGPVVGAAFYVFVPQWLQGGIFGISGLDFTVTVFRQEHRFGDFRDIFFGSLLVITMIAFPEGLVGIGRRIKAATFGKVQPERRTWLSDMLGLTPKKKDRPVPPAPEPAFKATVNRGVDDGEPDTPTVIEAEDIRVQFGGVVAVDGVSLSLHDNEILGLVGPNGSGKTTFLNALTGVVDATGTMKVLGNPVGLGRPGRIRGLRRAAHVPGTPDVHAPHLHRGRRPLDHRPAVHRHRVVVVRTSADGPSRTRPLGRRDGRAGAGRSRRPRRGVDRPAVVRATASARARPGHLR